MIRKRTTRLNTNKIAALKKDHHQLQNSNETRNKGKTKIAHLFSESRETALPFSAQKTRIDFEWHLLFWSLQKLNETILPRHHIPCFPHQIKTKFSFLIART